MTLPAADTLTIAVTDEDIRLGRPGSPRSCPIARATRRVVKGWAVLVEGDIELRHGDDAAFYELSKRGRAFISAFDAGKPVKPMTVKAFRYEGFR